MNQDLDFPDLRSDAVLLPASLLHNVPSISTMFYPFPPSFLKFFRPLSWSFPRYFFLSFFLSFSFFFFQLIPLPILVSTIGPASPPPFVQDVVPHPHNHFCRRSFLCICRCRASRHGPCWSCSSNRSPSSRTRYQGGHYKEVRRLHCCPQSLQGIRQKQCHRSR